MFSLRTVANGVAGRRWALYETSVAGKQLGCHLRTNVRMAASRRGCSLIAPAPFNWGMVPASNRIAICTSASISALVSTRH